MAQVIDGRTKAAGAAFAHEFPFTGSGSGAFFIETGSGVYDVLAVFHFSGTDQIGIATAIKAIARISNAAGSYSIRIFDATNAQVVAELTGQTNSTFITVDLGAISNLPTGEAEFEIQMLRVAPGNAQLASLTMEF